MLIDILKTNTAACSSIGDPFIVQLGVIFLDMLHIYRTMSEQIQSGIASRGASACPLWRCRLGACGVCHRAGGKPVSCFCSSPGQVTATPLSKSMRTIRREILRLLSTWISKARNPDQVMERVVPSLLEAVLVDYQASLPAAREHEVLAVVATTVNRVRDAISGQIMSIFAAVFEPTLEMITQASEDVRASVRASRCGRGGKGEGGTVRFGSAGEGSVLKSLVFGRVQDMISYPEHRNSFYNLLHAIVNHCFDGESAWLACALALST
jgi:hypothetical protein